ncbi:hypothetical protein A2410_00525 [Candidatus Shapirobacteria bacterium RIFOXYC1_FULL_38_24]|uniref:Core-binding (CB) domain-containing protein n=1 Tax=Candidatus Shapirobacteria bacterium RIFOXYB1_FULL_38_38 TaxID=1802151 RepID=A0A1F7SUW8_9BACT|nr:MAG: hypothetical protein A2367_03465 [Candidatus Shapirobacteria bacterium RIFOXYB1_FULL_38_38]OGL57974.1 MAG: hypothetical protein A2410_00525 [Candidatus Shapirobacteria bacterium RIFOXYC1_FULL_38_24]
MDSSALQTLTAAFRAWLSARQYSDSTVRNYLVDINKYISFTDDHLLFDESTLKNYFESVSSHPNYPRTLASLKKFFQFALDQKLIEKNSFKSALRSASRTGQACLATTTESLIPSFQTYLESKKKTPATIKNYINDIQQFINWAENQSET